MITFTFDSTLGKAFVEVKSDNDACPQTMIKLEDTSNETILKTCQSWMDAFGLTGVEYKVNVRLH